jgi:hypothetical protein
VLHASIVNENIHTPEVFEGFFDDLLAVSRLGKIGEDEMGFNFGVLLGEISFGRLDFGFGGEPVKNDIESLGSK